MGEQRLAAVVIITYKLLPQGTEVRFVLPERAAAEMRDKLMMEKNINPTSVKLVENSARTVSVELYNQLVKLFHLFQYQVLPTVAQLLRYLRHSAGVNFAAAEAVVTMVENGLEETKRWMCEPLFMLVGRVDKAAPFGT